MDDLTPEAWGWLLGFGLCTLLALLGIAGQAALWHASRPKLRLLVEGGVKGARGALKMLDDDSPTPTLLLILLIVGTGGAASCLIAAALTSGPTMLWDAVVIAVLAGLVMVVLAVITRAIAAARPEHTALALGRPIWAMGKVGLLLIAPLLWIERSIVGLLAPPNDGNGAASESDLRLLVEHVEDARQLDSDEREMISGIFGMSARPVREVMVPRIDVIAQPRESTLGEVLDRIVSSGYSRIPIIADTIDDVVGLVYAKDILRALRAGNLDDPVEPIARTAYFVPDTKKVDELLQDLQQKRVHMAIIVDEYGGTAGIVTIEDLLEEIVGEIRDEYDDNEAIPIERIDDRECLVDARVSIRDLNEAIDVHLDLEEWDTLGGLVYHQLGKVPSEGDEVRVNGCLVTVMTTQGRRLKKLRVQIVDEEARQL